MQFNDREISVFDGISRSRNYSKCSSCACIMPIFLFLVSCWGKKCCCLLLVCTTGKLDTYALCFHGDDFHSDCFGFVLSPLLCAPERVAEKPDWKIRLTNIYINSTRPPSRPGPTLKWNVL